MKKVLILIILIIILILLVIGWLVWKGNQVKEKERKEAIVSTYKAEYDNGENPKIKITNDSGEKLCFSSCYPYYLEKKDGGFESYSYGSCPETEVAEICLEPGKIKAFELIIDKDRTEDGLHRVAIPACVGCVLQENFRRDTWLYSNEFMVK